MNDVFEDVIKDCEEKLNACLPCTQRKTNTCKNIKQCEQTCQSGTHCVNCLTKMYNYEDYRTRKYQCEQHTYTYMLRFLNRYASEIYHIISEKPELLYNAVNKNIVSIGCGPATEAIGIDKAAREKNIPLINYYGFDANPIWSNVQEIVYKRMNTSALKIQFPQTNINQNKEILRNTSFLILHYLLSDIYKHGFNNQIGDYAVKSYLDSEISPLLSIMPFGSSILINDTNSCNMGRDALQRWSEGLSNHIFQKYFSRFQSDYWNKTYNKCQEINFDACVNPHTEMDKSLVFEESVDTSTYRSNIDVCGSCFVLLTKVDNK